MCRNVSNNCVWVTWCEVKVNQFHNFNSQIILLRSILGVLRPANVIMIVAEFLVPHGYQAISNHHADPIETRVTHHWWPHATYLITATKQTMVQRDQQPLGFSWISLTILSSHIENHCSDVTWVWWHLKSPAVAWTVSLTHLPLDKMATSSQTIFSDAFSWMKSFKLWLQFHWSLFLRVQ